jgi:hypothetical protein
MKKPKDIRARTGPPDVLRATWAVDTQKTAGCPKDITYVVGGCPIGYPEIITIDFRVFFLAFTPLCAWRKRIHPADLHQKIPGVFLRVVVCPEVCDKIVQERGALFVNGIRGG